MDALSAEPTVAVATPRKRGVFAYLKDKEVNVYPTGALRWWLMAMIVWAWTIEQFEAQRIGPVLVYVMEEFGITMTQYGQVAAVSGLAYGLGSVLLSRLGDRFGRRPLLIWPIVFYLGLTIAGALAPSFLVLASVIVMGQFTVAGMSPAVHAASRDITPQMGRAFAYSWVSLAFTAGALLSTVVAAHSLAIWPGLRPQFWIGTAFASVTALMLAIFYRDLSREVRGRIVQARGDAPSTKLPAELDTDKPSAYYDGSIVYRSARLWTLGATMIFWAIAYVTVTAYVPTYLAQYFHVEPYRAAEVTSFFWMTFTVSVMLSGWLSDRLRVRKPVTAFGGAATGCCFLLSASLPPDTDFSTLKLIWGLTGLFAGFIYPAWCAAYSETAEKISPFGVARAFGIAGTLAPITAVILNLGLPRVVANHGWPAWMGVAGGSCLCCAVLISFARGPWWTPKATHV
jgi:MFS family permease